MLLAACTSEPAPPATPATESPRPVRAMQVQPAYAQDRLVLPAEVRPRQEHRYGFRVGGKIAQRRVDVGQAVTAGQVLAVLDAADVTPAIAAQQAQVEAVHRKQVELELQQVHHQLQEMVAQDQQLQLLVLQLHTQAAASVDHQTAAQAQVAQAVVVMVDLTQLVVTELQILAAAAAVRVAPAATLQVVTAAQES
jgi:multidrug efflux pump subunit AcrA (membrane-fusion protein)